MFVPEARGERGHARPPLASRKTVVRKQTFVKPRLQNTNCIVQSLSICLPVCYPYAGTDRVHNLKSTRYARGVQRYLNFPRGENKGANGRGLLALIPRRVGRMPETPWQHQGRQQQCDLAMKHA